MFKPHLPSLVPGILVPALAAIWGGWATITVEDLPDYLVAQRPVTLEFTIRQHGIDPLEGLKPSLSVRGRGEETRVDAKPGKRKGQYFATFTPQHTGEWRITINSGFGPSRAKLLPITAVAPGTISSPLAEAERGRRLFVAKGCTTCHSHSAVEGERGWAPELTDRQFPPEYLTGFLADPGKLTRGGQAQMPDLDLKPAEIASLVAFLNTTRQARR